MDRLILVIIRGSRRFLLPLRPGAQQISVLNTLLRLGPHLLLLPVLLKTLTECLVRGFMSGLQPGLVWLILTALTTVRIAKCSPIVAVQLNTLLSSQQMQTASI